MNGAGGGGGGAVNRLEMKLSQSHYKGCVEVILKVELSFRFLYAATFSVCAITLVVVCPVMETRKQGPQLELKRSTRFSRLHQKSSSYLRSYLRFSRESREHLRVTTPSNA